jgi:hypothetical protein
LRKKKLSKVTTKYELGPCRHLPCLKHTQIRTTINKMVISFWRGPKLAILDLLLSKLIINIRVNWHANYLMKFRFEHNIVYICFLSAKKLEILKHQHINKIIE